MTVIQYATILAIGITPMISSDMTVIQFATILAIGITPIAVSGGRNL